MKALILCGGLGTRLYPFTYSVSKEMIKFCGKPLLGYHIEEFIENEIREFVIVCNKKNIEEVKNYLLKKFDGCSFEFVLQDQNLGPSHAVSLCEKHLDDYFILKYADSVYSEKLVKEILEKFREEKKDAVLLIREVKDPTRYGIVKFDGEKIIGIVEKPKENIPSKYAWMGLCILNKKKFFESVKMDEFSNEVCPPEHVFRSNGVGSYIHFRGERTDLGKPQDILSVSKIILKKNKKNYFDSLGNENVKIINSDIQGKIGEGSEVINSVVMGGAEIGKNCFIKNSVVGSDAKIIDGFKTEVGNGQIYVRDKFENVKNVGVFLGRGVKVKCLNSKPGVVVYPNREVENLDNSLITKVLVFDADGTLYHTKESSKKADLKVMKKYGHDYDEWREIVLKLKDSREPAKRTRKYSYKFLNKEKSDEMYEYFKEKMLESLEPNKYIKKILKEIPVKKVIMTQGSKETTILKLKRIGILDEFEFLVTSDDVGVMKPDKKYVDKVLERLGVEAKDCVFVGDSYEKDLEIAEKLGSETVLIEKDEDILEVLEYFS